MSHFLPAFDRTMPLEGGLQLTEIAEDNGGQTYAGLSRRANPLWDGWRFIDRGEVPPIELVRTAYRIGYWNPIWGDEISDQATAESIYDFAVNAGPKVAIRCAQAVLGVDVDGVMGKGTNAIKYVVQTGDLNVAGTWELQAYIEMPGWKGRGEWSPLKVLP